MRRQEMNIGRHEMARQKAIKAHAEAVLAHKKTQEMAIAEIQRSTDALNSLTKLEKNAWDKQYALIKQLEKYGIR
jgi:hypothetical protein